MIAPSLSSPKLRPSPSWFRRLFCAIDIADFAIHRITQLPCIGQNSSSAHGTFLSGRQGEISNRGVQAGETALALQLSRLQIGTKDLPEEGLARVAKSNRSDDTRFQLVCAKADAATNSSVRMSTTWYLVMDYASDWNGFQAEDNVNTGCVLR